ncbi:MAG: phenylalanine 4-monooxygenase [Robiginitomaculum sp.]|nr:phenylalanine 4-monooxygenase [Robiginitomaculum sp.]
MGTSNLRADPRTDTIADDFIVEQNWDAYTPEQHGTWDILYKRQLASLPGLACDEFMQGLDALDLGTGGIPDFKKINKKLKALTGWEVVAVPCLVPDDIFFEHLANRRFPAGNFIREREQLEYIQEPDVFHDVFGHVPMLTNPVFADYIEAYGKGGMRSMGYDRLKALASLYWYTVEFGLINTPKGMRIYGAGILSSRSESAYSLQARSPNRIHFDLERLMRSDYKIDDFQATYFIVSSFDELFRATVDTDFGPLYERLNATFDFTPTAVLESDKIYTRGTQEYGRNGGRKNAAKPV